MGHGIFLSFQKGKIKKIIFPLRFFAGVSRRGYQKMKTPAERRVVFALILII
jgi:hypothetical protein